MPPCSRPNARTRRRQAQHRPPANASDHARAAGKNVTNAGRRALARADRAPAQTRGRTGLPQRAWSPSRRGLTTRASSAGGST
jgi:hypothetical protein